MLSIGGLLIVVYRSRDALLTVGTRWHHLMRPAGQLWLTENCTQAFVGDSIQLCNRCLIGLLALPNGYQVGLAIVLDSNTSHQRYWIVTN